MSGYIRDVDLDRAVPDAPATAHAEVFSKIVLEIVEFMIYPLPVPFPFGGTRVSTGSLQGKVAECASIVTTQFFAVLIDQIKAMAGRAEESAHPAAQTRPGNLFPIGVFENFRQVYG